jgi:hypothetical protein
MAMIQEVAHLKEDWYVDFKSYYNEVANLKRMSSEF